jgi:hypothetical protein
VLAGLLALLLPVALWLISRALSPRNTGAAAAVSLIQSENPVAVGRKSNPRIFQALNASLVLILLALLMIPCVVTLPGDFGLMCILSLSAIAGLALLYGVRKQDLDWLKTYRAMSGEKEARK